MTRVRVRTTHIRPWASLRKMTASGRSDEGADTSRQAVGGTGAAVAVGVFVGVLALLWLFPALLFPNPTLNEAIDLAAWAAPLLLVVPVAAVASLFLFRRRRPAAVPIGLAVYILGVAAAMVLGLSVFGNFSNDQFLPLVLFPYPAGLAGLVTLVSALATTRPLRPHLTRGARNGLIGAILVGAWVLLRGARDWLVAPYGFDIALLIIVLAVAVVLMGVMAVKRSSFRQTP
jgi:hypothetical protein